MLDSDMFRSSPDHLQGVYNKKVILHVRVPEDDVNKIEACRSVCGLYVTVYILILCICWCCLLNCLLLQYMNTTETLLTDNHY
jgi:hypothetical protein